MRAVERDRRRQRAERPLPIALLEDHDLEGADLVPADVEDLGAGRVANAEFGEIFVGRDKIGSGVERDRQRTELQFADKNLPRSISMKPTIFASRTCRYAIRPSCFARSSRAWRYSRGILVTKVQELTGSRVVDCTR
jgi:hypothetical protein